MYENMTYEIILQRMLDKIPNTFDKREGSIIYDVLSPAAVELQLMYIELDIILNETFADTASREYLIRRALEKGIQPYSATYAILKAEFKPLSLNIPLGSRFNLNNLNYVVVEKISDGYYQVQCETVGVQGNQNFGDLIPINYVNGLETAKLTELLIPGEDEEDTETLRTRYFESFDSKSFSGNISDYLNKTNSLSGVGSTKVTPTWNGGGTVKLTILNSQYNKASSTLIESVQNAIDPNGDGYGVGLAPIGHVVTVDTVEEVQINITTLITFDNGYSFDILKLQIETVISEYLYELRKDWANQTSLVVRITQIESRILDVQGVLDITNTKLNDIASNVITTNYQVPVLGGVTNG